MRGLIAISREAMTNTDHLTWAERRLLDAVEAGEPIDLRFPEAPGSGDLASGASWEPERTVRAQLLIDLLTTKDRMSRAQPRALRLAGARITGMLDLEALTLVRPLAAEACFFEEGVRLDEARATRVAFKGCRVPTMSARQLKTRGDMTLDQLTGTNVVDLAGARIGGVLALRGAELENEHSTAFDGARLDVGLEMDCTGLRANGDVNLLGAHIGGRLIFVGAHLSNPHGDALSGEGLRVDQDMFCEARDGERFEATGELRLVGAHIGGTLSFDGARLSNFHRRALNGEGLRVERDMFCQTRGGERFEATGEIRLVDAHIHGTLNFRGAHLVNGNASAFAAERLQVDRDLLCGAGDRKRFEATGEVCLVEGHIGGQMDFTGARLSNHMDLALDLENVTAGELFLLEGGSSDGIVDLTDAVVGQFNDGWEAPGDEPRAHIWRDLPDSATSLWGRRVLTATRALNGCGVRRRDTFLAATTSSPPCSGASGERRMPAEWPSQSSVIDDTSYAVPRRWQATSWTALSAMAIARGGPQRPYWRWW